MLKSKIMCEIQEKIKQKVSDTVAINETLERKGRKERKTEQLKEMKKMVSIASKSI
jgi:hypothetical protein